MATATTVSAIEMSTVGIILAVAVTVLNIAIAAVLLVHRARKRKLKQKRKDAVEAPAKSSGQYCLTRICSKQYFFTFLTLNEVI